MDSNHQLFPDPAPHDRHSAITRRAHALWEQRGRPQGEDLGIWLEAEASLQEEEDFRMVLNHSEPEETTEAASSTEDSDAFTPDSGPEIATGHGRLPARHRINDK